VIAPPVRVALIEDNQVFREALELLLGLRAGIDVVASAEDARKVVELCREHSPDVLYAAGAAACLSKDEHLDDIVAGIRKAAGRSPDAAHG